VRPRLFRWLAIVFDLAVLALTYLVLQPSLNAELPDFDVQLTWLVGLSAVLTVLFLGNWGGTRVVAIIAILRAVALALLTVTVPVIDLRLLPVTLSFTVLLSLHTSLKLFAATQALWLGVILTVFFVFPYSQGPRTAGGLEFELLLLCSATLSAGAWAVHRAVLEFRSVRQANLLLQEEITRLANANLGFQQYASLLEQETTRAERLRLSREIHDSAGYALTSLKMLFEAAKGLLVKDPKKLGPLMDEGALVSQEALQEIRFVLHELRGKEEVLPEGLRLVVLLVRNFEKACGITVHLETTNTKNSYSARVNATLYRMVQEGMTNAFHHGRATKISIVLAEVETNLSIRIRDNGQGSSSVKKGIGLSGMEERVAEAGGWMQYKGLEDGFEIDALIPIEESP